MRDLRKNSKTHKEGDEEMYNISENCKCPKLFEELDRQDMKQNEFAKRIGASTGNVSDWASGKSSPTRRRWPIIAEVLGKPVDELMGTKKEPAGMGELDDVKKQVVELMDDMSQEELDALFTLLKSKAKK
jgi:transcriptional regulator with XRE-family HTH domain